MAVNIKSLLINLVTPFIDLLTLAAYFVLMPWLVQQFQARNTWNVLIIAGGYLLMCAGIFISKKLESNPDIWSPPEESPSKPSGEKALAKKNNIGSFTLAVSWPYSIFVMVMMAETAGVFQSGSSLGEKLDRFVLGGVAGSLIFSLGFLLILLLFPLLLLQKPRPKVAYGSTAHIFLRVFSVSAVNFMILITTTFWEWQLVNAEPLDVALGGKILIFVLVYVVFLMFYSPPRLALISLEPGRWSYTGFALLLAYTIWRFMS